MKNIFFILCLMFCCFCNAQFFTSYKVKTTQNKKERTELLNLVRAQTGDYLFIVNTLNVSKQYAWFQGTQVRRDGKPIETSEYEDCCHTEALLKRSGKTWKVIEFGSNSTDVWWFGLWETYQLPKTFFTE
ncbi:hypothetical protein [Tenacibaculum sp. M341]|uniref:hypothetical protein n=1 Tax=Tenacibaculum sp. M341 TaxID=2530339 RepID=UPI0010435723|nr:hypothetical protein [Tenacibaculum sp. M341]TCI84539.1 hypothetical protein EYW44_21075 [Tenacibaculum sp. M341]